ncbi:hypothetical protein QOT17_25610 [Balamuthia mandrillaris]
MGWTSGLQKRPSTFPPARPHWLHRATLRNRGSGGVCCALHLCRDPVVSHSPCVCTRRSALVDCVVSVRGSHGGTRCKSYWSKPPIERRPWAPFPRLVHQPLAESVMAPGVEHPGRLFADLPPPSPPDGSHALYTKGGDDDMIVAAAQEEGRKGGVLQKKR